MTTWAVRISLLAGGLLGLTACDSLVAPDEVLVIGTLSDEPQLGLPIDLPDTVAAGDPFVVTIRTTGSGCYRVGPTEVRAAGLTTSVVPFDYTAQIPGSSVDCDLVQKIFEHRAALLFETAGSASVTVRARDGSGTVQDHEHEILVR